MKKHFPLSTFHSPLPSFLFPLSTFLFLLLATGCKRNATLVDETHSFASHTWNHPTPERFEVAVDNADDFFHIDVAVTVDTALFRYDVFPLIVKLTSDQGEHRTFRTDIALRQNGHWRGDNTPAGRRVQHRSRSFFSFNRAATYTVDLYQATSQYDLEGVSNVQLIVSRAKVEMPQ